MIEKEINEEQLKLLEYLKEFYPSKEIDITNFFKKARAKYNVSDQYLYYNVYAQIENRFIDFHVDSIKLNFSADVFPVHATLKQEGYEYLNSIPVSKQNKRTAFWYYPLLILSLFGNFKTFVLDPNQSPKPIIIEQKLQEIDSLIKTIQSNMPTIYNNISKN
ncbi:MAG: hypothetical protein V4538_02035 [Bacteroidota bacterium]